MTEKLPTYTELIAVFEQTEEGRNAYLTEARRTVILNALRIAAAYVPLPAIPHASDTEKKIVGKLVTELLEIPGLTLSVNDGEEITVKRSTDTAAIYAALSSTGEDYLIVHELGMTDRWVRLIWGNDVDVISDYHTSLERYIAGANALARELDT